jgi:UDP-2,3-diacylglucosamine hydrolase
MVSDVHLEGQGPRQRAFVAWLDALEADELFLVGDVFHHWWGFRDGTVFHAYADVCAALERARARLRRLVVIPGNHDFHLGPFFTWTLGAEIRPAHRVELGGVPFWIEHGDAADRTLGYALARRTLRSHAFDRLVETLGPRGAWPVLRGLAGASRARRTPPDALVAAQKALADLRIAEGAAVVVMGHSHVPADEERGKGRYVNLGDWVEHRTWLEIDGASLRLVGADH